MDLWLDMIEAFFKHIIKRYGLNEVLTWYFEFWNEPEIEKVFWHGTKEEFFEMFHKSYVLIKSIDQRIKLGGFGNVNSLLAHEWLMSYYQYAEKHQIKLDFHTFHVYPRIFSDKSETDALKAFVEHFEKIKPFDLMNIMSGMDGGEEDTFIKELNKYMEMYAIYGEDIPLFVTEWNSSTYSRDLIHDTCFMGPFIIKNILGCHDKVDGMGFWTFSDIFEEWQFKQPLFHGGFGLMTYNGLKKPAYHAFHFLSKLGKQVIDEGDEYIITSDGDKYQILVYNYNHYNELYKRFDYSQITDTVRNQVFKQGRIKNYEFNLNLVGNYLFEEFSVSEETGSVFDKWVSIGAPDVINENVKRVLKSAEEPGYFTEELSNQNQITINVSLKPHEFKLIEISKIY
jgi:xylan 1,4-beta-xylosidase